MTDNLIEGLSLLKNEKYEEAFHILLPIAEGGNAEAQTKVGVLYQLGLGVERNVKNAFYWLEKAAKQGVGEAAHNLGTLYLTCEPDKPSNPEESKVWYSKAKDLGFIVAPDEWYEGD